jgi:hypothetical protein
MSLPQKHTETTYLPLSCPNPDRKDPGVSGKCSSCARSSPPAAETPTGDPTAFPPPTPSALSRLDARLPMLNGLPTGLPPAMR